MGPCIYAHLRTLRYQCHQWLNLNVVNFGYVLNDDLIITPAMQCIILPDDFPMPCKCQRCARKTVCRVKCIPCCTFCKCKTDKQCKKDN